MFEPIRSLSAAPYDTNRPSRMMEWSRAHTVYGKNGEAKSTFIWGVRGVHEMMRMKRIPLNVGRDRYWLARHHESMDPLLIAEKVLACTIRCPADLHSFLS